MAKPRKTGRGNREALRACRRAIKALCRDGAVTISAATAAKLGVTRQAVWKWDVVPPIHVPKVSELTGIPQYRLRPDLPALFPHPPKGA